MLSSHRFKLSATGIELTKKTFCFGSFLQRGYKTNGVIKIFGQTRIAWPFPPLNRLRLMSIQLKKLLLIYVFQASSDVSSNPKWKAAVASFVCSFLFFHLIILIGFVFIWFFNFIITNKSNYFYIPRFVLFS